ncbi:MAG: glycosyltransferase [Ignavibacteria bacterium]
MKIIYITTHNPPYEMYKNVIRYEVKIDLPNGSWLEIYRGDWGDILGKLMKKEYPDVEFEFWQYDSRADKIYEHRFDDGILHKRFPARLKKHIYGLKLKEDYFSSEMVNSLLNIDTRDTLVHLGCDYNYFGVSLFKKFHNTLPMVGWFILNVELNIPNYKNASVFQKIHRYLFHYKFKKHLQKIKYPIVLNDDYKDVISNYNKNEIFVLPWTMIDFDFWKNDLDGIELRKEFRIPTDKIVFFSSSRIIPSKQIDFLIKVFANYSELDYTLYISGATTVEYLEYLKNIISTNKLEDKVILLGYVDEVTLKKYYILSDYFISSSLMEGGPTSGLYALALEKKLIVTDTGFVADILKEKDAGLVLPTIDYEKWKDEILKVFMGFDIKVIPRKMIMERYNTKKYVNDIMDIYLKSINNLK